MRKILFLLFGALSFGFLPVFSAFGDEGSCEANNAKLKNEVEVDVNKIREAQKEKMGYSTYPTTHDHLESRIHCDLNDPSIKDHASCLKAKGMEDKPYQSMEFQPRGWEKDNFDKRKKVVAIIFPGLGNSAAFGKEDSDCLLKNFNMKTMLVNYSGYPSRPESQGTDTRDLGVVDEKHWRVDGLDAIDEAVKAGADRIVLVGHSTGAKLMQYAALKSCHKDKIKAMILQTPAENVDWKKIITSNIPGVYQREGVRAVMAKSLMETYKCTYQNIPAHRKKIKLFTEIVGGYDEYLQQFVDKDGKFNAEEAYNPSNLPISAFPIKAKNNIRTIGLPINAHCQVKALKDSINAEFKKKENRLEADVMLLAAEKDNIISNDRAREQVLSYIDDKYKSKFRYHLMKNTLHSSFIVNPKDPLFAGQSDLSHEGSVDFREKCKLMTEYLAQSLQLPVVGRTQPFSGNEQKSGVKKEAGSGYRAE